MLFRLARSTSSSYYVQSKAYCPVILSNSHTAVVTGNYTLMPLQEPPTTSQAFTLAPQAGEESHRMLFSCLSALHVFVTELRTPPCVPTDVTATTAPLRSQLHCCTPSMLQPSLQENTCCQLSLHFPAFPKTSGGAEEIWFPAGQDKPGGHSSVRDRER